MLLGGHCGRNVMLNTINICQNHQVLMFYSSKAALDSEVTSAQVLLSSLSSFHLPHGQVIKTPIQTWIALLMNYFIVCTYGAQIVQHLSQAKYVAQCTMCVSAKCLAATKVPWHSTDNQDGYCSLGKQEVGGRGLTVQETTAGWQSQMSKQSLCDSAIYYGISRHCCYCRWQRKEGGGEVCVCACVFVYNCFKTKWRKGKAKRITSARSRL